MSKRYVSKDEALRRFYEASMKEGGIEMGAMAEGHDQIED